MSKRIDHVAVAVKDLEKTLRFFTQILDLEPSVKVKIAHAPHTKAAFIPVGDVEIEFLEPTDPQSSIAEFIARKGEGLHHISIQVRNVEETLDGLRKKGIKLIDEKPRIGFHGVNIAFLNPESTNGILIELCQESKTREHAIRENRKCHQ
jgi:methylmalonyl-CoA/ethylmalonyl-CoA epimerase